LSAMTKLGPLAFLRLLFGFLVPVALCLQDPHLGILAASFDDEEMRSAVEKAIDASGEGLSGLKVRCDAGILTLGGTAPNLSALRKAIHRAGAVPGIVDIVTAVTIPRHGIPDSQILTDVQNALSLPSIPAGSVQVQVMEGRVTLKGSCGSSSCKMLAEEEAAKIGGVVEITNRIQIPPQTSVSEQGLARLVKNRLASSLTPVSGKIQVTAKGSSVTLTGRVPLYLNRLEASEAALSVPGVASLDNRLLVDPALMASSPSVQTP
jgi:osmotically-inducible protein OsmY